MQTIRTIIDTCTLSAEEKEKRQQHQSLANDIGTYLAIPDADDIDPYLDSPNALNIDPYLDSQEFRALSAENQKIITMLLSAYKDLLALEPGQIVKDSDNFWSRRFLFDLLVLALLSEFGFAALQFTTSSVGWQAIVRIKVIAYILATTGTVLDFLVNISTISPANDADAGVFSKIVTDSFLMLAMLWIVRATSLLSYFAGASGNILGVLPLLLQDDSSALIKGLVIALTVVVAIIGTAYYSAFNGLPTTATFLAIEKYLSAKKADNNFFRWIKIIEENIYLYGFRAGSFAAIGVSVLKSFINLSGDAAFDIAAMIFFASVVNLAATRSRKIVDYWSNNNFAFIEPADRKDSLFIYLPSAIVSKDTLSQLAVSTGFILLALESSSKQLTGAYYFFAVSLCLNNLIAQCDKAANEAVCKKLPDGILDERRKSHADQAVPEQQQPLLSGENRTPIVNEVEESRQARINAAGKAYQALSATFPQDTWDRFICTAGSTLTRGIGFTDFASTLSLLLGLTLTSYQTLGIVLVLAPTNMRNMFSMFYGNMVEYGTQKEAEAYISSAPSYTLFTKSAWSYKKEDIQSALIRRAKEYGYSDSTLSSNSP